MSAVRDEAARLGIVLRADGGRIIAEPSSALTRELAEAIDLVRTELLAFLVRPVPPPTSNCPNCHGTKFFARPARFAWTCGRCHPPLGTEAMVSHEVPAEVRDG